MIKFDFNNRPINLNPNNKLIDENFEPVISVITAYYNGKKYIDETANAILNQTYPYFEWLIIDDGSTDQESLKKLEEIKSKDFRIKVLHKQNSGLASTRDYGAAHASKSSKYFYFIDDDDIPVPTYLECAYWTLETNKGAAWAYADIVSFGGLSAVAPTRFDPELQKTENQLSAAALVRRSDFELVGGYNLNEKSVNEDWNFWLKLQAKGKYPVRMNYWGLWYRRKDAIESEMARAAANRKRCLEIINQTVSTIKENVPGVLYPKYDYNWEQFQDKLESIVVPKYKENNKRKILMFIPWITVGGADKFNVDLIKGIDKEKFEVTVITTEPNINSWRPQIEPNTVGLYDLTTFLDQKHWLSFINYIIEKNQIEIIFNTNSKYGYSMLPYIKAMHSQIPIIDYVHMEEWYWRNGGYSRDTASVHEIIDKTLLCNENSRKILVNHFNVKEEETQTVYIGVDEEKFNPEKIDKNEIKERLKVNKNKKVISFIARIEGQKRPYLLIEILNKLSKERNDFVCVIAGNGSMLKPIKQKAKHYKIYDNIVFLGEVKNTKEIYAISDVTLNCSIKEGLALTSYESLAMGVPVVSADVGGQKELINENVGSIVPCMQKETDINSFNYSDEEIKPYVEALNKILNNLDKYKAECRKTIINKFTINQMVENMSNIILDTIENPNQEKIANGQKLYSNLNICKELITKTIVAFKDEYIWLAKKYDEDAIELAKISNVYPIEMLQKDSTRKQITLRKVLNTLKTKMESIAIKLHIINEFTIVYNFLKEIKNLIRDFIKGVIKYSKFFIGSLYKLIKLECKRVKNLIKKNKKKGTK